MNVLIRKLQESLNSRLGTVADDTRKYIRELESIKSDSKDRFESYYNRKKWFDYLIIANLSIVPILLIILSYVVFFKK